MKSRILLFLFVTSSMVVISQTKKSLPLLVKKINENKTTHQLTAVPSKNHADYAITQLLKSDSTIFDLKLKNNGNIASPFEIQILSGDSILKTFKNKGFKENKTCRFSQAGFSKIKLVAQQEHFVQNNTIQQRKLLKKLEPIKFYLGVTEQNPDFTQVFGIPVAGWNYHDKILYGAALYSNPLAASKLEYLIMPLYSTERENIGGNINASYTFYPGWLAVNYIKFGIHSKKYGYDTFDHLSGQMQRIAHHDLAYTKFAPELHIDFSPAEQGATKSNYIIFRNIHIKKDIVSIVPEIVGINFVKDETSYYMNSLLFAMEEYRENNPYTFHSRIEQNNKIVKASAEFIQKINYSAYKKQLKLRLFYGTFIYKNDLADIREDYRFRLSSWAGNHDYLYDYHFFGRQATNQEVLNQQVVVRDGGFKVPTTLGQTWDWLGTANLDIPFPGKIPLGIYLDAGVFINKEGGPYQKPSVMYDAGAKISLIHEVFEIYLPALFSEDIQENLDLNKDNYLEKIRFSLYLNKLNPLKERITF